MTTRRTWPPIPLSTAEREALRVLCFLVRRGLLGPATPGLYARLAARTSG